MLGLAGEDGGWINDKMNTPPRIDPEKELAEESIQRHYDAVRQGAYQSSEMIGSESAYQYLLTEDYNPIVG